MELAAFYDGRGTCEAVGSLWWGHGAGYVDASFLLCYIVLIVIPDFCTDTQLHDKIVQAYNHLWNLVDANRNQLSYEVWSWKYDGKFEVVQFGELTNTESNIRQLWSLTFLAVKREDFGGS